MYNSPHIDPYLRTIEYEYGINIIGAWDRGSRAWNLHTDESDYDIRICFTQPHSNYLTLTQYTSSIQSRGDKLNDKTIPSDIPADKIEFQGWDIKRFLELLTDNNPSIYECLASPITYQHHPIFDDISEYCLNRIHYIELWKHYLSATKSNYNKYILGEKDLSAKRNLFILRNMLCAEYIKNTHEYPTIDFDTLLEESPEDSFRYIPKTEYQELAELKRSGEGNKEIGNKYQSGIEEFLQQDFDYESHIPEQTIQSEDLDEYLSRLIQSTTLFL